MPSIQQLERLLEADPADPFVLYGLAQEYAKQANLEKALEFFDRCLTIDPGYCYAYYHKARVLGAAGRTADARQVLKSGIEAARRTGDGHAGSEMEALLDDLA